MIARHFIATLLVTLSLLVSCKDTAAQERGWIDGLTVGALSKEFAYIANNSNYKVEGLVVECTRRCQNGAVANGFTRAITVRPGAYVEAYIHWNNPAIKKEILCRTSCRLMSVGNQVPILYRTN